MKCTGRTIGSALIDMSFFHIVSERLNSFRDSLTGEPELVADRMVHGRFERVKCSYGTAISSALPTIPIEVPGLAPGHNFPDANIEDSKMIFTHDELQSLFDQQVDRMISVIDEQYDRTYQNHPRTQIVESCSMTSRARLIMLKGVPGSLWRVGIITLCQTAP